MIAFALFCVIVLVVGIALVATRWPTDNSGIRSNLIAVECQDGPWYLTHEQFWNYYDQGYIQRCLKK